MTGRLDTFTRALPGLGEGIGTVIGAIRGAGVPETTLEQALQAGERLCDCIGGELFRANRETRLRVTASVGIATLEPSDDGVDALLKRADGALYAAKRNGRNRVMFDAA